LPPPGKSWNEANLSEHPAIRQLVLLGYMHVAAETLEAERESLKEVVLNKRLTNALKKLNPWLSDDNLSSAVLPANGLDPNSPPCADGFHAQVAGAGCTYAMSSDGKTLTLDQCQETPAPSVSPEPQRRRGSSPSKVLAKYVLPEPVIRPRTRRTLAGARAPWPDRKGLAKNKHPPQVGRRRGKTGAETEGDEEVGGPHTSEEVGEREAADPAERRRPVLNTNFRREP
jgi:hypothetical protein